GERYDIIVTNPPYVDAIDLSEMPAEYAHEPALALGSGEDGLDVTRRILMQAKAHLQPHGLLVLEVGNSWEALEAAFPQLPFTWIEFEHGGHGVCVLSAAELPESRPSAA
ncbi:MAG TPA: 50S ribosomal protein L3 N(5)-glutamine methyltransferase, partial [Halieaceae bacterium]|nr:50S ribosomal protein L3 N(5)-glutamine methyltransferase [Halieaceae bacterium]